MTENATETVVTPPTREPLPKVRIGDNPITGRPLFHYDAGDKPVVVVGPFIHGTVTTHDGTEYRIDDDIIVVDKPEHAGEVSHAIGVRFEQEGHPLHTAEQPFYHLCTDHCERLRRPGDHPAQKAALLNTVRQIIMSPEPHAPAHFYVTESSSVNELKARAQDVIEALKQRVDGWESAPSTAAEAYQSLNMARASAAAENAALNGLAGTGSTNVIPDVSLHTADPGTTGASENANSGSYARQAASWNAASGGSMTNSGSLTFSTGGSVAVAYFGTWSSATYGAGTYAIGGTLNASVTSTSITIAAGALSFSAS